VADEIKIKISGDYDDQAAKQAIEDAKAIEKADPELQITADADQAKADIATTTEAAQALSREDVVITIKAQIDAAKADLDRLQTALRETGEAAEDTDRKLGRIDNAAPGGNLRGNAIADLTGPLGEASGAASDFAGVFDGLGDIAGETASKLGLSAGAASTVAGAITGLGVVVAAGAAVWSIWSAKQKEAEARAKEHKKAVDDLATSIRKGDREAAVANFHKLYDDAIASAEKFGLKQQDIVRFLSGETDAIPGLTAKWQELTAARDAANVEANKAQAAGETYVNTAAAEAKAFEDLAVSMGISRTELLNGKIATEDKAAADEHLADMLVGAEEAQQDMNTAVANSISPLDRAKNSAHNLGVEIDTLAGNLDIEEEALAFAAQLETAMTNAQTETGNTRQEIIDLEQAVIDAGRTTGQTPFVIKSTVAAVERGDLEAAGAAVESWYRLHPVSIASKLALPKVLRSPRTGGLLDESDVGLSSNSFTPAPAAQVFNVNLPRGARASDIAKALRVSSRRNGTRYLNPVVTYAGGN